MVNEILNFIDGYNNLDGCWGELSEALNEFELKNVEEDDIPKLVGEILELVDIHSNLDLDEPTLANMKRVLVNIISIENTIVPIVQDDEELTSLEVGGIILYGSGFQYVEEIHKTNIGTTVVLEDMSGKYTTVFVTK